MQDQGNIRSLDILAILQEASGQYVSGEHLSQHLGISRAAVWKRISALKKEGFLIEAVTRKGYRLNSSENPYGKPAILNKLVTHTFGKELKFFTQVDSTNSVLKQLAAEGAPEGTIVVAESQTGGRGRLGRSWVAPSGTGIWLSLLLKPKLHPGEVQTLTLAASVAVCRALEHLNISGLGIKWPNDVLIGRKKVCGILTELSAEAERIAWVILGIGLNVNHLEQDFSDEIASIATSLRLNTEDREPLDRSMLAAGLINALEEVYEDYLKDGASRMIDEWKNRSVTLGKKVRLISHDGSQEVLVQDITQDGKLVVKQEDGQSLEVLSGEISLREL